MRSIYPGPDVSLSPARQKRLRGAMGEGGHVVAIVSAPENVLYATGYESMPAAINRRHLYCAAVTADAVFMALPAIDLAAAVGAGLSVEHLFPHGEFYFAGNEPGSHSGTTYPSFEEAISAMAKRLPAGSRIVEAEAIPATALAQFGDTVDTAGAAFMLAVRSVKLPQEVALMRAAAEMTERAIEAGMAAAAPGRTDKQIAAVVAAEMCAAGGFSRNVTVVGGLHSAYADAFPQDRVLREGDLLRFDVGCSFYGYKSDLARTAVIGKATALQLERYEALREGLAAEIAAVAAGVPARAIFDAGMDAVQRRGFDGFRRHHLGHSIGLAVYEQPVILPTSNVPLREGALFCLETPYYEPGWGGMMCEDTGIVTSDGFELISTIDRSLRQLG